MSTNTTTAETTASVEDAAATAATTETTAETGTETPTLEELQTQLAQWRGHARDWETKAKANLSAKQKLDELEAAQLSETERLARQLAELTAERDAAATAALRARVSASKGVPEALLSGSSEDELNAAADLLLAFRGEKKAPANDTAASGQQGAPIAAGAQITSRDQLASMTSAEIVQAKKDGLLDGLLGK